MNSATKEQGCFQLKADFFPITVFKLVTYRLEDIKEKLPETIEKAPKYFDNTPVILDFTGLEINEKEFDLNSICHLLRENKIIPIGVRGLSKKQQILATKTGLAIIKQNKSNSNTEPKTKPNIAQAAPTITTKIITRPIRAGTQVYAKGGDLIVLAAVNAGAECFADGNIHIYGPLRGKVLAGVNGNTSARIFCKTLQAELVSIAGLYLVNDEICAPKDSHAMIQIYLDNNGTLKIESI